MSIAYLDPGNIESDLQSGAVAEFKVRPQMRSVVSLIRPSAVFMQNVEHNVNVKFYVCVCVDPYLQCVLHKKIDRSVVSFCGIQGDYVIRYVSVTFNILRHKC